MDVKLSNFVLRKPVRDLNEVSLDNEVVLVDAGIAQATRGPHRSRFLCAALQGTPTFMAPEQVHSARNATYQPSPAIDAVALGRSLLLMFCFQLPTDAMSEEAVIAAVRDGTLMDSVFPASMLPAPAAMVSMGLWLSHHEEHDRLSVEDAATVFAHIHERAAAGHDVSAADLEAAFGLPAHPLLENYPVLGSATERAAAAPTEPGQCAPAQPSSTELASAGCESEGSEPERAAAGARDPAGPSFVELHADALGSGNLLDMAHALHRSSGAGEDTTAAGQSKAVYAAVPEIRVAGMKACRASEAVSDGSVPEGVTWFSPRISAFGERVTVHSCCAPEADTLKSCKASSATELAALPQVGSPCCVARWWSSVLLCVCRVCCYAQVSTAVKHAGGCQKAWLVWPHSVNLGICIGQAVHLSVLPRHQRPRLRRCRVSTESGPKTALDP